MIDVLEKLQLPNCRRGLCDREYFVESTEKRAVIDRTYSAH